MGKCNIYSVTSREKSILNRTLETIDSNKAEEWFAYTDTPAFKEMFGDYKHNYDLGMFQEIFDGRVYPENGEPMLIYDKELNKHYFISEDNEKYYYPHERGGVHSLFTPNQVKEFTKSIALRYYEDNVVQNKNNFSFENIATKSLIDFIGDYIDTVSVSLEAEGSMFSDNLADTLISSLMFDEEWANLVKKYFSTIQIKISEEEYNEIEEDSAVETRGSLFKQSAFLNSSKNNILSNVKLYLSLIKDINEDGTPKLNEFGQATFVSYDDIYSTLNKTLANTSVGVDENGHIEDIFELYKQKIKDVSEVKPYLNSLLDKLNSPQVTELFKNQFSSAFNLYKNLFLGTEFTVDENNDVSVTVKNLSDVGSRASNLLSAWHYNFTKQESEDKLKQAINNFAKLVQDFNRTKGTIVNNGILGTKASAIREALIDLGITTSPQGFNYFLNGNTAEDAGVDIRRQRLDDLINRLYGKEGIVLKYQSEKEKDTEELLSTNFLKDQSIVKELAMAVGFFEKESSDASIFTMGKTKWIYSNPSHLDIKFALWKKDPTQLLAHYLSNKEYHANSEYMKFFLGMEKEGATYNEELAKDRLAKVELGIFNSLQEAQDSINASDNKDLSQTDMLTDYIHKVLGQFGRGNKSWMKTALAADKSTEYQVNYGIPLKEANIEYIKETGEYKINGFVTNVFFGYFMDEYNRMKKVAADINNGEVELLPNYHLATRDGDINGLKSQMFPSLSITFKEDGTAILPSNLPKELDNLYNSDGQPNVETFSATQIAALKKVINKSLVDKIKEARDIIFDNGLVSFNEKGALINNSIDSVLFGRYTATGAGTRAATLKLAGDLFINSAISQAEYAKMFTGDLAFYKSITDYKKRVPSTYTDGLYMRLREYTDSNKNFKSEKIFNAAIIEDVRIDEPSLEAMKSYLSEDVWKNFINGDSTDAQAWITPARWKFLLDRLGKWTDAHQSVYDKMYLSNPDYSPAELKALAQPLKGVYFDVKEGRPTYLKYSQAVLMPNFIKGTGLQKLYDKMTEATEYEDQIHELITVQGIKVGAPIPTKTHNKKGEVLDDFKLNKIELNNAAWKLQQDLPTKGIKETDLGTQIQKNIFQGLVHNLTTVFNVNGTKKDGDSLIDYLNELTEVMGTQGLKAVTKRLGIDPDTKEVTNEAALYKGIITQLSKRKDVSSNMLDAMKAGLSPYAIPGGNELFQNVFSSIINKSVVKIKTQGGGFIQTADYGLTKAEAEKVGIKYTPWFQEDPSNRLYASKPEIDPKTGKEVIDPITGKKKISPGGIFISGSMIAKYIPDYEKYSPTELFGTLNKHTGRYENAMIDQDILEHIIGFAQSPLVRGQVGSGAGSCET